MIRAVVFDFDGVIANSEPLHFRAYRDVLTARGINLTESAYYEHYLGYDDVGAFRAIAADAAVPIGDGEIADLVAQKAVRLEALEKAGSVLFPGAREAILRIADAWPIAIASGALKGEILRVLEHESLRSRLPCCRLGRRYAGEQADPARTSSRWTCSAPPLARCIRRSASPSRIRNGVWCRRGRRDCEPWASHTPIPSRSSLTQRMSRDLASRPVHTGSSALAGAVTTWQRARPRTPPQPRA